MGIEKSFRISSEILKASDISEKYHKTYKKDEKLDIMHIAICRLLEPFGYYEFDFYDEDGWPHYNLLENLPFLKGGEQTVLLKQAIIQYFTDKEFV